MSDKMRCSRAASAETGIKATAKAHARATAGPHQRLPANPFKADPSYAHWAHGHPHTPVGPARADPQQVKDWIGRIERLHQETWQKCGSVLTWSKFRGTW